VTACAALHVDAQPDAVLVVVDQQFPDALYESAGSALVPEDLAAAAEIMRLTGLDRARQRFCVHVPLHEQLAGLRVGRHHGDQTAVIELRRKIDAFFYLLDRFARLKFDASARHCRLLRVLLGDGQITGVCRTRQYCYH
jgi:hypothetical protein